MSYSQQSVDETDSPAQILGLERVLTTQLIPFAFIVIKTKSALILSEARNNLTRDLVHCFPDQTELLSKRRQVVLISIHQCEMHFILQWITLESFTPIFSLHTWLA